MLETKKQEIWIATYAAAVPTLGKIAAIMAADAAVVDFEARFKAQLGDPLVTLPPV